MLGSVKERERERERERRKVGDERQKVSVNSSSMYRSTVYFLRDAMDKSSTISFDFNRSIASVRVVKDFSLPCITSFPFQDWVRAGGIESVARIYL